MKKTTKLVLEVECTMCPGDGVVRGRRAGVDWPTPCSCRARQAFTQYSLGKLLEEDPKTIARVFELRASSAVAARVLSALDRVGLVR